MRRLPDDPTKRRLQIFKRCFQHLEHFKALIESGEMEMPGIIVVVDTVLGVEEIYLPDLMTGILSLPDRQREAFELICLRGFTEGAATDIMLPESQWSTPIQQYADTALARMVKAYDEKQAGTWVPRIYVKRSKCTPETADTATSLPAFEDEREQLISA
jgi:hypothetical protein